MFKATILAAGASLSIATAAAAQGYQPDIVELKNLADSMAFPADASMDLSGGGTVEFWVQPDWKEDPGYDPVVLSNAGPNGASYLISITGAKDGVGIMAGDRYEVAPFNFSDGKMHFVAVNDYGDQTLVMVDNRPIAQLPIAFADLPSAGFWIGSADGATAPFTGAIAGLRIWDAPVDPDILGIFAQRSLVPSNGEPHPDLASLVGMSDFANHTFALAAPDPIEAAGSTADTAPDATPSS